MVVRKENKKLPTNKIKEKNIIKNNFLTIKMEDIEVLSKRTLDREIPFISTTSIVDVYKEYVTENNFNTFLKNFNAFLKNYDNDSLIFNISLTNKNNYIRSLNERFASKKNKVLFIDDKGKTRRVNYCEHYINSVKNMPNDMIWVNELTSRELRCFQKNCFGEIIFDSSTNTIKDDLIKNRDCYVFHIPGLLYVLSKKDKCLKINFVQTDLPYNLFNEKKG